jgi:tetratricopeptide (TPR) repeat protein
MDLQSMTPAVQSRVKRLVAVAALAVLASAAAQAGALARARVAYNQQRYDEAIAAAREATSVPATASQAQLLVARACIERFRLSGDAADLATARNMLAGIDSSTLTPRDRGEMQIGLAELLFFDDRFGAAADLFESALSRTSEPGYGPRERLLGWFATSLDRLARLDETAGRRRIYRRLLNRMVVEDRSGSGSAVASYWIVAATFGADDVEDAWDAAVATWIRAPLVPGDGVALRADIDRLVLALIIPRRARLASAGSDVEQAAGVFRTDWESVKQIWPRR